MTPERMRAIRHRLGVDAGRAIRRNEARGHPARSHLSE